MPIVKIPSNFVSETASYTPYGAIRAAKVLAKGIENLTPDQKDYVMRNLKKTTLGASLLALGWFNSKNIGGYYQEGEKRKKGDTKVGDIKIMGIEIPHVFLHAPALEMLQFGATLRRIYDKKKGKEGDAKAFLEGSGSSIWGIAKQQPFIGTPLQNAESVKYKGVSGMLTEEVKGFVIPRLIQEMAEWEDARPDSRSISNLGTGEKVERTSKTPLQIMEMGIPTQREKVPKKKSSW